MISWKNIFKKAAFILQTAVNKYILNDTINNKKIHLGLLSPQIKLEKWPLNDVQQTQITEIRQQVSCRRQGRLTIARRSNTCILQQQQK